MQMHGLLRLQMYTIMCLILRAIFDWLEPMVGPGAKLTLYTLEALFLFQAVIFGAMCLVWIMTAKHKEGPKCGRSG